MAATEYYIFGSAIDDWQKPTALAQSSSCCGETFLKDSETQAVIIYLFIYGEKEKNKNCVWAQGRQGKKKKKEGL